MMGILQSNHHAVSSHACLPFVAIFVPVLCRCQISFSFLFSFLSILSFILSICAKKIIEIFYVYIFRLSRIPRQPTHATLAQDRRRGLLHHDIRRLLFNVPIDDHRLSGLDHRAAHHRQAAQGLVVLRSKQGFCGFSVPLGNLLFAFFHHHVAQIFL